MGFCRLLALTTRRAGSESMRPSRPVRLCRPSPGHKRRRRRCATSRNARPGPPPRADRQRALQSHGGALGISDQREKESGQGLPLRTAVGGERGAAVAAVVAHARAPVGHPSHALNGEAFWLASQQVATHSTRKCRACHLVFPLVEVIRACNPRAAPPSAPSG